MRFSAGFSTVLVRLAELFYCPFTKGAVCVCGEDSACVLIVLVQFTGR